MYYPVSIQRPCSKYSLVQRIFGATKPIKKCPLATALADSSAYQEYLLKCLQDKYNMLNTQFESVVRESNTEINRTRYYSLIRC